MPCGMSFGSRSHQGLALTMDVTQAFLLLTGNPDHGQLLGVSLHIATQALAECAGIQSIGLYSFALLIELARSDDKAGGTCSGKRAVKPEAKAAGLINH